ncbi:MAG: transcriptional repressor [Phormidesmis sp.]
MHSSQDTASCRFDSRFLILVVAVFALRSQWAESAYRSLRSLQVKGLAQSRTLPNGEWVYTLASDDSHYLTCLNCGTSVPIEECPAHSLEEKLAQTSQFQIFYHTIEFCGPCRPYRRDR